MSEDNIKKPVFLNAEQVDQLLREIQSALAPFIDKYGPEHVFCCITNLAFSPEMKLTPESAGGILAHQDFVADLVTQQDPAVHGWYLKCRQSIQQVAQAAASGALSGLLKSLLGEDTPETKKPSATGTSTVQ